MIRTLKRALRRLRGDRRRSDPPCGDWDDGLPDCGVREPRRPKSPSRSGTVVLDPPEADAA